MKIKFQTRELSPDERRMLKSLHTRTQKAAVGWIKWWHYLIAVALGVGGVLLAIHTERDSLRSLFALTAVISLGFVFFTPSVILKQRRERRELLQRLSTFIERGTVGVHPVSAERIALAREYEDEGDLYIVELDAGHVLYIDDAEYNMSSRFPCLRFEIYDNEFASLTGRRVLPQSGKVQPVEIDPKRKWAYWMAHGAPGDLTVENVNFDSLAGRLNATLERASNIAPVRHDRVAAKKAEKPKTRAERMTKYLIILTIMKKLLILFAAIGIVFFSSCETYKDSDYLEDTSWGSYYESDEGWSKTELVFTSTHATFKFTSEGGYTWGFTGTYTYDPPTVKIKIVSDDYMNGIVNTGTVKKNTMNIGAHESDDLVMLVELKKQ